MKDFKKIFKILFPEDSHPKITFGSVSLYQNEILGFSNVEKPKHFAVCQCNFKPQLKVIKVNLCSTQGKKAKDLYLPKGIISKEKDGFVLRFICSVLQGHYENDDFIIFKKILPEPHLSAYRNFVTSNSNKLKEKVKK
ncbi:hypothetical protein IT568_06645 [bacterium]|nr:hypothetical protein [bacterium]